MNDEYNKRCKICDGIVETEGEGLCNFCISSKAKEITTEKKVVKKQRANPLPKPKYVKIKCIKCKKVDEIRANNPEIYTEEVRAKWECFLCSGYKKIKTTKEVSNGPTTETSNPVPEQQG